MTHAEGTRLYAHAVWARAYYLIIGIFKYVKQSGICQTVATVRVERVKKSHQAAVQDTAALPSH